MSLLKYNLSENKILTITLDDPSTANAFSPQAAMELAKRLDEYKEKCNGLLFQTSGQRFFCTGGNLKVYAELSKSEALKVNKRIKKTLDELSSWPHPTVCVVAGDCFGGGLELLSAFDQVYSTPESNFGFWQRRISLTFGWGGYTRLLRRVEERSLKRLALEARSICSYEALRLGLVDEVGSFHEVSERAKKWLDSASRWPKSPVKDLKRLSIKDEFNRFKSLWHNPEHLRVLEKYKK